MISKVACKLFFLAASFFEAKTAKAQVIWHGDTNRNYLVSFYRLSREAGEQGSVTTVNDPVMGKVWSVNKPAGSKRAELARTNGYVPAEGETVYVGWRYKFSIAGNVNPSGGMAVFQLKSQDDGSQNYPILMGYNGSKLLLVKYVAGTTPQADRGTRLWEAPLSDGQWVSVVLGIKFSRNQNLGYVEFWFNGVKQDLIGDNLQKQVAHRTLDDFGNYFKWGSYNENARPYDVTVNLDEMRVARTYAEAEPNNYNATLSIEESGDANQGKNTVKMYPVPVQNELNIALTPGEEVVKYEVIDLSGKVIITESTITNNTTKLYVSTIPKGEYLLKVYKRDATIQVSRFVK
jgi:hypothetical protein